jgi:hypothetical protein
MRRCADAPMRRCADAPMRRCADAPMRRCADAPMRRCADAPMRRYFAALYACGNVRPVAMHEAVDSRQTLCNPLSPRAIVKPLALAIGVAQLIARYVSSLSDIVFNPIFRGVTRVQYLLRPIHIVWDCKESIACRFPCESFRFFIRYSDD